MVEAEADPAPLALLLAPPLSSSGERACFSHRLAGEGPPDRSLAVLLTDRPEARVRGWRAHAAGVPDEAVVLASQRPRDPPSAVEVRRLDSPGDLSGLGVDITDWLAGGPTSGGTAFCFDSVTALLQYVATDEAVRFFETLRPRLAEANVVGHLHLNPGAHDAATVARFEELADGVVAVDEDGADAVGGEPVS